jgi:glucose uptake protein GlcU
MTISVLQRRANAPEVPGGRAGRYAGVAMMFGSGLSNQLGAALGALAFPVILAIVSANTVSVVTAGHPEPPPS